MFCYQGWKTKSLSILVLVNLLDKLWIVFTFVHTWYMLKPKLCRTKNLMQFALALGLGWRRRILFLARLKGRNIFGLCFLSSWLHHPGPWWHPWFLRRAWFPCPCLYPWPSHPLGLDHDLGWILWKPQKFESLKFLENSKICNAKKNDSPRAPYIEGKT